MNAVAAQHWFQTAAHNLARRADPDKAERAAALLDRHYGLTGEITPLSSEVERTAEVRLHDGRTLMFKTATRPEAIESFRFQSAALGVVHDAPGVRVSELVPTRHGERMFVADGACGYLQTRLEGEALHRAPLTEALIFATGAAVARLGQALERAEVPAANRPVLWNIACWPHLMGFVTHLPSGPLVDQVRAAMADYATHIAPRLPDLDWQITHNDPSPHNVILTADGPGFIDFGDGGWNPRLQDLAIAAGHMVTDPSEPLGGAAPLVAGYASVRPLSDLECGLLVGLMRARQAALILINRWRSHLFPDEGAYINKNLGRAERGLEILSALDDASATATVKAALTLPYPHLTYQTP
ncbi:phosphotransferase [Roseicitreum antarcticum]|uniref:Hydroxylysine kinase n=1 Tax=Roseicitreum antarcticum TaxID=564137 RepID=A0A1H3DFI8_9RHOB|nr:phosphotransferase [Roseicitreum antarcticum]SDX65223.1 Ser/Thr protein kinase RdoA involved in Cpx stress response, MazF antagonist [Roseicitreum antarcticum]